MNAQDGPSPAWLEPGKVVFSRTVPWAESGLLPFLRRAAGEPRFFWQGMEQAPAFAGFGAAAVLTASGAGRFESIRRQAEALFSRLRVDRGAGVPESAPGARLVGGFSFAIGAHPSDSGIWAAFPEACFILPRYLLHEYQGEAFLTGVALSDESDAWAAHEVLWNIPAPVDMPQLEGRFQGVDAKDRMEQSAWETLVMQASAAIRAGSLEKVVLARARELPGVANPLAALARLSASYPECIRFLVEPAPYASFFGATPELLARVRRGQVQTMALAGSGSRGKTFAEDEALGANLLSAAKERHEHDLVVRDVEARLRPLASDIAVGQTSLLKLSNIQHLSTPIQAQAGPETGLIDIVAALHPTPAVGGLPAAAGLDFLQAAEPVPRGWYAAPVGWLDAEGDGEFVVALRSGVTDGSCTRLYAGAGIVAGSDPAREWRETALKFRPMMDALGVVDP